MKTTKQTLYWCKPCEQSSWEVANCPSCDREMIEIGWSESPNDENSSN